jgi:hypothetical protein
VKNAHSPALEVRDVAEAANRFVEVLLRPVFAGEEAVGEAVEGKDREPVAERRVAQVLLELLALDEIVPGLESAGRREAEPAGR